MKDLNQLVDELKNLRETLEQTNRDLSAISEFCGLLYEEKYGKKSKWNNNGKMEDIEFNPHRR